MSVRVFGCVIAMRMHVLPQCEANAMNKNTEKQMAEGMCARDALAVGGALDDCSPLVFRTSNPPISPSPRGT
jgi:hypothetical protein